MSRFVLLAVAVAVVVWIVYRLFGGGKVATNVVQEKIRAGATIVDVRTVDEFRDGAYQGAVNIPLGDLNRRAAEIPKDKAVVLYCASGARSAAAARALRALGYTDVVNAGGLADMPR